MGRKQILELVFLGLWIIIAFVIFVHYKGDYNKPVKVPSKLISKNPKPEIGKVFLVKRITIIKGDLFDIVIKDGTDSRILAKLKENAVENSKKNVLELFNNSVNPKVVLKEKQLDGKWVVNLFLTHQGEEINVSEWLIKQNLIYK